MQLKYFQAFLGKYSSIILIALDEYKDLFIATIQIYIYLIRYDGANYELIRIRN